MERWSAEQYLKFADERTRAARELLARVPLERPERVLDLGCGPGNSTALLAERYPVARVCGVDNSADMLERARADLPQLTFLHADLASFQPDDAQDLLFANAVLQWLPSHEALLPRLFSQLRPGGVLAFQVPDNLAAPSHRSMRTLPGPWAERIGAVPARTHLLAPAQYYDLLAREALHVDIWHTTYEHVMSDAAAIVEWVKGTGLRPYLDALPQAERAAYLTAYTQAIDAAYPARADGKRLFSFPRLFLVAVRA